MSDYITFEIQEEIIKRLPVKSLIQFRSVSKAWKALIDSNKFIAAYSVSHNHPHHLLIRYKDTVTVNKYVSFVDDNTFPQQKFAPTVPESIKQLQHSLIVGCSTGLICLYGHRNKMVVLWNPSIRKSVAIDVHMSYNTVLGFGVCPETSDPKIVKITPFGYMPWEVEVYTLSSGEWITPSCNLPRQSIGVIPLQVVIGRLIYWLARDMIARNDGFQASDTIMYRIAINNGFQICYTIMSFDMTTYEFKEVCLLDSLAQMAMLDEVVTISKVWESLAVLVYSMDTDKRICAVWMMENSVPNSFTKLFTIKTPYASMRTLGFKKSGEPIMVTPDDSQPGYAGGARLVYETCSKHIIDLGIYGIYRSFRVNSYVETLLLLNQ